MLLLLLLVAETEFLLPMQLLLMQPLLMLPLQPLLVVLLLFVTLLLVVLLLLLLLLRLLHQRRKADHPNFLLFVLVLALFRVSLLDKVRDPRSLIDDLQQQLASCRRSSSSSFCSSSAAENLKRRPEPLRIEAAEALDGGRPLARCGALGDQ